MVERRGPDERPRSEGRGSDRSGYSIPRVPHVSEGRSRKEDPSDYIQGLKEKYSDEHTNVPRQRSLGHFESDEDWRVEAGMGSAMDLLPLIIVAFFWVLLFTVHLILAGWEGMFISIVQVLLLAWNMVLTMFFFMAKGGGRKRRYGMNVFRR